MKTQIASALVAASLALPVAAWAQSATPGPVPGTTGNGTAVTAPQNAPDHNANANNPGDTNYTQNGNWQERVNQHIDQLRNQLHVTSNQEASFNKFADVMRDNARAMENAIGERVSQLQQLNAVDNMKSYAALARQHARNVERLASAFGTFYDKLTPEQKQQADQLFRARSEAMAARHNGEAASAQTGTSPSGAPHQ
jgi:periplasmic protein CpxP/Spy